MPGYGVSVPGFTPSVLNYNVVLPFGTVLVPTVTATTRDGNATKAITPAGALPGSTTVLVTAEDGTTTKTYTINFTVAIGSADATLSSLMVDGTMVSGFDPMVLEYNVVLPHGTIVIPTVTATVNEATAHRVITSAASLPGTTSIVVTAGDGTTINTYLIHFTISRDSDAKLIDLRVNGTTVPGFTPLVILYEVVLPHGTVIVPTVTATTNDPNATKVITPAAGLPGTTTIVVTAENSVTTKTYTIQFTVASDSDASLSDLKVNGTTVSGFDPAILTYNVVLAHSAVVVPTVTASTNDPNASKVITPAAALPGSTTVIVTAEDGTTKKTYTVVFTLAKDTDTSLSDLKVNGTTVAGFASGLYAYTVVLPHNSVVVPILTATTNDPNATKVITPASHLPGTSVVLVTAEDGTTKKAYSVTFNIAPDTDATLSNLTVNGVTVEGFSPSVLNYEVALPPTTTEDPVIGATTNDPNATKTITQPERVRPVGIVVVKAEDGTTTKTYTITFSIVLPSDPTLVDLKYNGITVPGFNPGILFYSVVLPYGTVTLPIVTATTHDAGATKVITNPAALPGTAKVKVTAQDGVTSLTYSINFTVDPKSNIATLSDLKVNGTTVSGFSPTVMTYHVVLPHSTLLVPVVTATTTDPKASKVINTAAALPGNTTIQVTAENGIVVKTYTVSFSLAPPSTDATLSELKISGSLVADFSPEELVYEYVVGYGTVDVPVVTAKAANAYASLVITNAASIPDTTRITVTAEDGTTILTYKIAFRYPMVGIDQTANLATIQVFPNPSKGKFELVYTSDQGLGNTIEIRILDVVGQEILRLVQERSGYVTQIPIDLLQCQSGIYFIQVRNAKDRMVKTLIVE